MNRPEASPNAGGCDFQAAALDAQTPLWTPHALPSVVPLENLPPDLSSAEFAAPLTALLDSRIGDADFVVFRASEEFRAHAREKIDGQSLAVTLPLDQLFEHRVSAALRLWRAVSGRAPGQNLAVLPAARTERLILALRALDGRLDDANYRDIAEAVYGADAIPEQGWKTHDVRDRTVRLVRYGVSMMRGGYRHLLLHPFRRKP